MASEELFVSSQLRINLNKKKVKKMEEYEEVSESESFVFSRLHSARLMCNQRILCQKKKRNKAKQKEVEGYTGKISFILAYTMEKCDTH